MDFVPAQSAIRTDIIEVDSETIDMLVSIGMVEIPGVVKRSVETQGVLPVAANNAYGRGNDGGFARRY